MINCGFVVHFMVNWGSEHWPVVDGQLMFLLVNDLASLDVRMVAFDMLSCLCNLWDVVLLVVGAIVWSSISDVMSLCLNVMLYNLMVWLFVVKRISIAHWLSVVHILTAAVVGGVVLLRVAVR